MAIKIKPVLCGKKKCKKLHYIFAYDRHREGDGKIHDRYLGKVSAFDQKGSIHDHATGTKYDEVYILPPHTGKYRKGTKGGKTEAVKILISKRAAIRKIMAKWEVEGEEE